MRRFNRRFGPQSILLGSSAGRVAAGGLLLAAALTLGGCNKPTQAAAAPGRPDAAQIANMSAVELYNADLFAEAKAKAEADIRTTTGREREVSTLTAGLAAHALKQPSVARFYLQGLTSSKDPAIAGRAEAVLGQIAQNRGNHVYAANLFERASEKLEGDDAAKAKVRAGTSMERIGKQTQSIQMYQSAASEANSPAIRAHAANLSQQASGPFAIQAGVFSTRANAEKRARELTTVASRAGLGAPTVVPDTINGRPAFAVRVGNFPTKQAASDARTRLGPGQFVVTTMQ